jgi:hypothetical protein
LLEEDSGKSSGKEPVTLESEWDTVEEFTQNLNDALTKGMGSIQETEFDSTGVFRKAFLEFESEGNNCRMDVFVDRLGRVVLPAEEVYSRLLRVSFFREGGSKVVVHDVVRMESRYEGHRKSALVVYLETQGAGDDVGP